MIKIFFFALQISSAGLEQLNVIEYLSLGNVSEILLPCVMGEMNCTQVSIVS